MKRMTAIGLAAALAGLAMGVPAGAQMIFEGDGSRDPGFVPPRVAPPPPPPPAHISSAETYIPYPGPPVVPQARSEKKKPPKPPVLFTKVTSPHGELDWNTRPNDLNNLLKSMHGMIDVSFSTEVKALGEVDTDPERNPILYRSGHFRFSYSPAERERLRDYLLRGGMIIFNTGMGSKPFYDSARAELMEIFPEAPVQRLGPDHSIFHSYYDLDTVDYRPGVRTAGQRDNRPWFEGVTINCRTVALISRWCMAVGWDELEDDSVYAYSPESARKLGINIMAYATAQRAWSQNVARAMEYLDADAASAGKMNIAQVIHNGDWKTRHAGLSLLLHQFNQKTEIPVKFDRRELRLTDPALFDSPLLYITGHEDFTLDADEIAALRRYLQNGGVLFAEACCGRRSFDEAFRREMRKVLPGQSLAALPPRDMMFVLPNRIEKLAVTPALAAAMGNRSAIDPSVLGVELGGHYVVLYSPFGLAGGWELSQNPYALGYENADALLLGENLLMYTITH